MFSKKKINHSFFGELSLKQGTWCGGFYLSNCADEVIEVLIDKHLIGSTELLEFTNTLKNCNELKEITFEKVLEYMDKTSNLFFKIGKNSEATRLSLETVAIESDSIFLSWGLFPDGASEREVQVMTTFNRGNISILGFGD